jgi:hypothetical protein
MLDSTISAKDTAELANITHTNTGSSLTKNVIVPQNPAAQDEISAVEAHHGRSTRKHI